MTKQIQVSQLPDGRLDAKNAATYLGCSVKTLATLRCQGRGPKFVKRGRIFYFQAALDEWLREGEAASTAEARLHSGSGRAALP